MNPDDIRQNWQMLNRKVDALDERTRSLAIELRTTKSQTLQQRLSRRYRTQSFIGMLLPVLSPTVVWVGLPVWVAVLYGIVGVVMAAIHMWFARFISRSDYKSMPVVDAMAHAAKILRMQIRIKKTGYLLGCIIVIPLLYEIWNLGQIDLFISAVTGGVIGGIFGLYKQRVNNRIARQLVETLENDIK
ncbi:MAG: hypothetical protein K2L80_03265 [Muribaculaceae bacterium]|nr:hypothetical protein [Muribaculaceae bacterium]